MNLGKRVEAARLALGWTQAALCSKVEGLSQQALDRLEKRDSVRSQFAPGLAAALNIPLEELLTGVAGSVGATQAPNRAGMVGTTAPPPAPGPRFADRREVSESDWGTLQDVLLVLEPAELERIRAKAERMRRVAAEQLDGLKGKP